MRMIVSPTHIAVSTVLTLAENTMDIDIEASCMTPYGFLFPIHHCVFPFIRVLRGEVSGSYMLENISMALKGNAILVDHLGKATLLALDSDDRDIMQMEITKGYMAYGNPFGKAISNTDARDAMRLLMRSSTSMEHALERFNSISISPLHAPEIYSFQQLATRLKETNNTRIFMNNGIDSSYSEKEIKSQLNQLVRRPRRTR